jgi:hypothetical protein
MGGMAVNLKNRRQILVVALVRLQRALGVEVPIGSSVWMTEKSKCQTRRPAICPRAFPNCQGALPPIVHFVRQPLDQLEVNLYSLTRHFVLVLVILNGFALSRNPIASLSAQPHREIVKNMAVLMTLRLWPARLHRRSSYILAFWLAANNWHT